MRIAALGDAHLGRAYYPYTTDDGVNQRERDFEVAFERAVDLALAQEPDLVVWLGDVFDHPRPSYRSYRVAQRALQKIREEGPTRELVGLGCAERTIPRHGAPVRSIHSIPLIIVR